MEKEFPDLASQELEDVPEQEVPDEIEIEAREQEPEVRDEAETEAPPVEHKKKDAKSRINELSRQKYQAIDEMKRAMDIATKLQLENEQLRRLNTMTTDASYAQQEISAKERLERAKERKAFAIESGDIKAQVDADIDIASAVSDVQKLEYDKTYKSVQSEYQRQAQELEQQYYQNNYNQRPEENNKYIAEDWLKDNDWFLKGSRNFDPRLHAEVDKLCDTLDATLYRNGQQHMIHSAEYFDYIDQQLPHIKQQLGKPAMQSRREVVEPVRNGTSAAYSQKNTVRLSPEEKELVQRLGVKADDYAKRKALDQIAQREKFKARGGY